MSRLARLVPAALGPLAVAIGITLSVNPPANATIWWEAPPRCVQDQWHKDKQDRVGHYTKASEYKKTRIVGGDREVQYIWVFYVEVVMYPYGTVPGGRAEKHCGSDHFRTHA